MNSSAKFKKFAKYLVNDFRVNKTQQEFCGRHLLLIPRMERRVSRCFNDSNRNFETNLAQGSP